jgi:MazG family protein
MENAARLLEVMATLRDPDKGCAWDIDQTFETIAPYTLEEAYEVADAIARGDMDDLRDELGDLLLQVVFHAQMADEAGLFDFESVAGAICEKMIRRHPHVFSDVQFDSIAEQKAHWEQLKAEERQQKRSTGSVSALDGVAVTLPALVRAEKVQKRAARVGFDWTSIDGVFDKVHEELAELHQAREATDAVAIQEELGDLLFTVVNLSRHLGYSPEETLRQSTAKFERRFRVMEQLLGKRGKSVDGTDAAVLDQYWQKAKSAP